MLRVHHTEVETNEGPHRATLVTIDLPTGQKATSKAICRPPDQFNRAVGRRLAANRLLSNLRVIGTSYEDRRTIFQTICPEYFRK